MIAGNANNTAKTQMKPIITITILDRALNFFNGLTIPVYLSNAKATNVKIDTPIETSFANSLVRQIISPISPSQGHLSYTKISPAQGTAIKITRRSPNANEKIYLEGQIMKIVRKNTQLEIDINLGIKNPRRRYKIA